MSYRAISLPSAAWFGVSFVVYVVLALSTKSVVLNWIIGPLWLFLTLWLLPTAFRWAWSKVSA
jgi:hypothetical protein